MYICQRYDIPPPLFSTVNIFPLFAHFPTSSPHIIAFFLYRSPYFIHNQPGPFFPRYILFHRHDIFFPINLNNNPPPPINFIHPCTLGNSQFRYLMRMDQFTGIRVRMQILTCHQVYLNLFPSPLPPLWGKFIKSFREEYQASWKEGKGNR